MPKPPTKMLKERANKRGCETRRVSADRARPTCACALEQFKSRYKSPIIVHYVNPRGWQSFLLASAWPQTSANFGTFGRLFGQTHFQTKIQILSHLRATKNPSQRTAFSSASTTKHRRFPLCILSGREMCITATSACCRRRLEAHVFCSSNLIADCKPICNVWRFQATISANTFYLQNNAQIPAC